MDERQELERLRKLKRLRELEQKEAKSPEFKIQQNDAVNKRIADAQTVKYLQEKMSTPEAWLADIGATLSKVGPNFRRIIGDSDDPEALAALKEIEQQQELLRTAFPSATFGGDVSLPGATAAATVPMGLIAGSLAGAAEAGLTSGSESNPKIQAAIAGAAPAAIAGVGKLGSGIIEVGQNILRGGGDVLSSSPTQQASRYMARYMDEAGVAPEDILRQRELMGEGSVLADVPAMRGISQDVATDMAGRPWIDKFKTRLSQSESRLINRMTKVIGKNPDDFTNQRASVLADRKLKGNELYNKALFDSNGAPVKIDLPPTRKTNSMLNRLDKSGAFNNAKEIAEINGAQFSGGTTLQDMHYAKMALDDMRESAIKDGNNARANALKNLKDELVDQIESISPTYKVARKTYADDSSVLNAMDLGETAFNPKYNGQKVKFDEMKGLVDKFSPSEFESFQLGVVRAIRDKLETIPETADSAGKLWRQTKVRKAIQLAFKDEAQFQGFLEELKVESAFTDTLNDLFRGSQTAQRTAAQQSRKAGGFGFKEVGDRILGRNVSPEGMQRLATMMYDDKFTNEQIRMALIDSGVYDENLPLRAVGYMRKNFDMIFDYYNDKAFRTGAGIGVATAQGAENDTTN